MERFFVKNRRPAFSSLFLLVNAFLSAAFFFSCDMAGNEVRGYFDRMTSTAEIMDFKLEPDDRVMDADGNMCIPSGQDHVAILYLRNPRHFEFTEGTTYSWNLPDAAQARISASNVQLSQLEDATIFRLTYTASFLRQVEGGIDISPSISLKHPVSMADFGIYEDLKLKCNSVPPPISNVIVKVFNGKYVLCMVMPDHTGIHQDLQGGTLTVNGTSYTLQVISGRLCPGDSSFSVSSPGPLTSPSNGFDITFDETNPRAIFYSTGINVSTENTVFNISIADTSGLSAQTSVSSNSTRILPPVLYDNPFPAVPLTSADAAEAGFMNGILQEESGGGRLLLKAPEMDSAGHTLDTSGTTTQYIVYDSHGSAVSEDQFNGAGSTFYKTDGIWKVEVWAVRPGYVESEHKFYNVKIAPVTITFNGGSYAGESGTISGTSSQTVPKGTPASLISKTAVQPSYTGYTFLGWAETNGGTTAAYADGAQVTFMSDTTLYAVWEPGPATYKVKHLFQKADDATVFVGDSIYFPDETAAGTTGQISNSTAFIKTGITGFETGTVTEEKIIAADGTTEVEIRYERKSYTLTYNKNTGSLYSRDQSLVTPSVPSAVSVRYGASVTLPSASAATCQGYTLYGWAESLTGSRITSFIMPAANKTLYAKWNPATNTAYTVRHLFQNASGTSYAENLTLKAREEKTGTTGADTSASGGSFTGFTAQAISQQPIKANGSTIVDVKYNRNSYDIHWESSTYYTHSTLSSAKYGAEVEFTVTANSGYALHSVKVTQDTGGLEVPVTKSGSNYTFTMPAGDVTITPKIAKPVSIRIGHSSSNNMNALSLPGGSLTIWAKSDTGKNLAYTVTLDGSGEFNGSVPIIPASSSGATTVFAIGKIGSRSIWSYADYSGSGTVEMTGANALEVLMPRVEYNSSSGVLTPIQGAPTWATFNNFLRAGQPYPDGFVTKVDVGIYDEPDGNEIRKLESLAPEPVIKKGTYSFLSSYTQVRVNATIYVYDGSYKATTDGRTLITLAE
ncbi:MAG TPA: hypothetical protein DCZ74_00235 [Treponema sp.]|nr:hypothetical protein [Treponema sp.]